MANAGGNSGGGTSGANGPQGRNNGIQETFKDPADAIGDLNGEARLAGKGKTKEAWWRCRGYTETEYYLDSNGTKWTVFKNPKTGDYSGGHVSSGQ